MSRKKPTRRQVLLAGTMAAGTGAMFGFSRTASAATDESKWIHQIATFNIQEGKEDDAVKLLRKLTKAVEAKEPGTLTYIAHQEQKEPTKVVFYEVFESEAAMKAHGAQPHLNVLRKGFGDGIFKGPVEIKKLKKVGGFSRQAKSADDTN